MKAQNNINRIQITNVIERKWNAREKMILSVPQESNERNKVKQLNTMEKVRREILNMRGSNKS